MCGGVICSAASACVVLGICTSVCVGAQGGI
jgi:hypothetical protein